MYYLMIKTHNKTGLKYLCQTRRKNPYAYTGSGKYWKIHLAKHGIDIKTEVLGEYTNTEDLKRDGLYYSELYNVTESKDWANLRPECGDGGRTADTPGYIAGMKQRRSYSGSNNPNYGKVGSWAGKVGPIQGKRWFNNGVVEMFAEDPPEGWFNGRLKVTCEYCNMMTNMINYKRWHGDRCKQKEK